MNEFKVKYILSFTKSSTKIRVDMAKNPDFRISSVTKEFENHDNLTQHVIDISSNNSIIGEIYKIDYKKFKKEFEEEDIYSAKNIIDLYFKVFNQDYIDKSKWDDFLSIFNIKKPSMKTNFYPTSSDNNLLNIDLDNFLQRCINNQEVTSEEIKKVINTFFSTNNALTNVSFEYVCYSTRDMLVAVIDEVFKNKPSAVIMKCQNCGKLFIPKNSTAKYCDRISPQFENKTCKQAMDSIKKEQALNDPTKRLQKNIYNTLYSSYSNKKTKENKKILDDFKKESIVKKVKYKSGKINQEEYIKWLKSFYKTK